MSFGSARLAPNMCPSLTEEVYKKLQLVGIENSIQFLTEDLTDLSKKSKISLQSLQNISQALHASLAACPVSGKDLYQESLRTSFTLSSGYQSIDDILNGGFQAGELLELYGESGVGKTTLCLNFALHASIRCQKKVLYVDPLASVNSSRVVNLLEKFAESGEVSSDPLELFQVVNPTTLWELFQILEKLSQSPLEANFCTEKEDVEMPLINSTSQTQELLIIDSFAQFIYPLIAGPKDNAFGLLNLLEKKLKSVAKEKGLVVILVNNGIKTNAHDRQDSPCLKIKPAFGKMWAYVPHHRVLLEQNTENSSQVIFNIVKSTRLSNSSTIITL